LIGSIFIEFLVSNSLTFLVLALIAALLGFTTVAGASYAVAKILFFVFLVLLVVSLVTGYARTRPLP
jgi:uncharacterized membrane protein YtjA (UPF0391 family)